MEKADELLGAALKSMRDSNAALAWLQARWASLIGEAFAGHIRPLACQRGVLRLEADSREWKAQAEAMEKQVRDRINRSWRGLLVRELQIEFASRGRRLAYELDNNHLPFLRKNANSRP